MIEGQGLTAASAQRDAEAGTRSGPEGPSGQPGPDLLQATPPDQSGHAPSPWAMPGWPSADVAAGTAAGARTATEGAGGAESGGTASGVESGGVESGGAESGGTSGAGRAGLAEPYVRVNAGQLESALLTLRHPIVSLPLTLQASGVDAARAERRKMLSQIDDYLLPRLRQSGAPILVALVGSTGAGKSTLMNSLAGMQVSATGIRRPTTNSPVLACHPSDIHWFAENVFLPTLPRVRQQGLAMPGRDGLLVLAASEGMPRGVALLDTPDIDSVVQAHRAFAHQFLDASDLWLFMTSARRYADAAVWELLQEARDRGAALAIVLSRVPAGSAPQITAHFEAMLEANGLREMRRFMIAETVITDSRLPAEVSGPVREWLEETAAQEDRRVAVLTQTMAGVLDTFRARIPALAEQVERQVGVRAELHSAVTGAYEAGLADLDEATRNGSLLRGEILARWQDFAGAGDLMRTLQVRRGRGTGRSKKGMLPIRAQALKNAIRSSTEALVASIADRAAEEAVARWRQHPAGRALLAGLAPAGAAEVPYSPFAAAVAAALAGASSGPDAAAPDRAAVPRPERTAGADVAALARSSPLLARKAAQVISEWQDHVTELVQAQNVTKRSIARIVSFDDEALALVLTIGVLGYGASDAAVSEGTAELPQRLLTSLFGAGLLRDIGAGARHDLHDRISLLFATEMQRFTEIVDSAGAPDGTVITELRAASQLLEAAR